MTTRLPKACEPSVGRPCDPPGFAEDAARGAARLKGGCDGQGHGQDGRDGAGGAEVLHFTAEERAARGKAARAEVPRASHAGFELIATVIPCSSSWTRRRRACPSSCRSATDGCWSRRSRSTAALRRSWRTISRRRQGSGSMCSSAATRTSPTSAATRRPSGISSSTSTTSTRRCPARSSGT